MLSCINTKYIHDVSKISSMVAWNKNFDFL